MFIHYHLTLSRIAFELIVINNEVALKDKKFKNIVVIVKWCRKITNDATRFLKLKVMKNLILKQQKILKDFVAEFMQHIQHNSQFSIVIWHELKWQNFIIITLNAQQRQKRFKSSIRIMKRYWNYKKINALMSNIRSRHVNDETIKLTKRYLNEYEKVVRLMQQAIL